MYGHDTARWACACIQGALCAQIDLNLGKASVQGELESTHQGASSRAQSLGRFVRRPGHLLIGCLPMCLCVPASCPSTTLLHSEED